MDPTRISSNVRANAEGILLALVVHAKDTLLHPGALKVVFVQGNRHDRRSPLAGVVCVHPAEVDTVVVRRPAVGGYGRAECGFSCVEALPAVGE